jgi:hypothetical protein
MSPEKYQDALDDLMTLESAAQHWPQLFTAIGLRRAARAGQFQHIHKGRKRFVTERALMKWLHQDEAGASCLEKSCLKSAGTGSRVSKEDQAYIASGMTKEQEKFVAAALKQRMLKRPKG